MPLHVFEDRYRALVHHLLTISDKSLRLFGIVAIREGYEVGQHGVHSVHRVGCVVQMTSVEPYEDGRFDIEVVGPAAGCGSTASTRRASTSSATWRLLTERTAKRQPTPPQEAARTYGDLRGVPPPALASCAAATSSTATCPATRSTSPTASPPPACSPWPSGRTCWRRTPPLERLVMLRHALREEMRAMRAIPSLPATEVARTSWSPN